MTNVGFTKYMSPEHLESKGDNTTDLYSLGVLLHDLVFGLKDVGIGAAKYGC